MPMNLVLAAHDSANTGWKLGFVAGSFTAVRFYLQNQIPKLASEIQVLFVSQFFVPPFPFLCHAIEFLLVVRRAKINPTIHGSQTRLSCVKYYRWRVQAHALEPCMDLEQEVSTIFLCMCAFASWYRR